MLIRKNSKGIFMADHQTRAIGFHLRLESTIGAVAQQAIDLGLTSFQCFLVHQKTKRSVHPTEQEINQFRLLTKHFYPLVLHGAYWINIATVRPKNAKRMLHQELMWAERLGFTHYVLHPGAALGWDDKQSCLKSLAEIIEEAMEMYPKVELVLENAAHAGLTIGGNLEDFAVLNTYLHSSTLKYCIDTAHAYVYGYKLKTDDEQKEFIKTIRNTIGIDRLSLLHINDTKERFASKRDKHDVPGHGVIGCEALKHFVMRPELEQIPIIFELPPGGLAHAQELITYFST